MIDYRDLHATNSIKRGEKKPKNPFDFVDWKLEIGDERFEVASNIARITDK